MHDEELTALLERAKEHVSPAASTISGRLAVEEPSDNRAAGGHLAAGQGRGSSSPSG